MFYFVVVVVVQMNGCSLCQQMFNTMSCPIKVKSYTIELTGHTPCYCILDLLGNIYLVKIFWLFISNLNLMEIET